MADLEAEKARAALRAVEEVRDGMLVGLGTGSTAAYAVREIGRRIAGGLRISATATSNATAALAREVGIPLVEFEDIARLDLTIDGADEIDPGLRAIKGGGGALLREKIVAAASDRMIAIVDSSKPVASLGRFALPVEVVPFAARFAERALARFETPVSRRRRPDGSLFLTDQGNYVFDLALGRIDDPAAVAAQLDTIPGVVEHGLFLEEVDIAVVGRADGVEVLSRNHGGTT